MAIWHYFALFHLVWGAGICFWWHRVFKNGFDYILKEDQEYAKKFAPFRRTDLLKWNRLEIYICATFLLPSRALGSLIFTLMAGICNTIIVFGADLNKELSPVRRTLVRVNSYLFPRLIFWCWGFYWIEKKYHRIADLDPTYPKDQKNPSIKAPVIVSNHISFIDIVYYLTSRYCPGFLSKAGVAKVPIVGKIAKARQSLFVERADRTQKDAILDDLKRRVEDIAAGKPYPPILIYPEGTTADGKNIITFKKGAFCTFAPVRIMVLQYPKETFSPAYDNLDFHVIFLGMLSQFYNRIIVNDCGIYDPSHLNLKEESDWVRYAEKVRAIMCKCIGATPYDIGFQEKNEYYGYSAKFRKQLREAAKQKKTE